MQNKLIPIVADNASVTKALVLMPYAQVDTRGNAPDTMCDGLALWVQDWQPSKWRMPDRVAIRSL